MPAGRPRWKRRPAWLQLLDTVRDGRWYARAALRQRTGLNSDALSAHLANLYRKGLVWKRANPLFDHSRPNEQYRRTGIAACPKVYAITPRGHEVLEAELALRDMLEIEDLSR